MILRSVSSRIRAISAFDHSRMPATSSSACARRSAASVAERPWIDSMWVFASAWSCVRVCSRASSAAACIAFVRSARNFVGLAAGLRALVGTDVTADTCSSLDGSD